MATLLTRCPLVYGIPGEREKSAPVIFHDGITAKRIRWKFRNNDFVKVYVRTDTGVRLFLAEAEGVAWHIRARNEQGENR